MRRCGGSGVNLLHQLRLLVLGETRSLPLGVARRGRWRRRWCASWRDRTGGGATAVAWLLLALVLGALWLSLRGAARANP